MPVWKKKCEQKTHTSQETSGKVLIVAKKEANESAREGCAGGFGLVCH